MRRTKAISFSLDTMSLKNLRYVSEKLGVGQSALVQNLVNEKAGEIRNIDNRSMEMVR